MATSYEQPPDCSFHHWREEDGLVVEVVEDDVGDDEDESRCSGTS